MYGRSRTRNIIQCRAINNGAHFMRNIDTKSMGFLCVSRQLCGTQKTNRPNEVAFSFHLPKAPARPRNVNHGRPIAPMGTMAPWPVLVLYGLRPGDRLFQFCFAFAGPETRLLKMRHFCSGRHYANFPYPFRFPNRNCQNLQMCYVPIKYERLR